MPDLTPIYTRENCRFSCPLQWGLTVFWRKPERDDRWYQDLAAATEPDGIRLLSHRFSEPGISQFAISTQPHVSPLLIVQRVKGRLQHLVRQPLPKAFRGNYAIRSVGSVTRELRLVDLDADICEEHNLAAANPEAVIVARDVSPAGEHKTHNVGKLPEPAE